MFKKIIFSCLLLFSFSCSKNGGDPERLKKPTVLVSIAPYRFLADRIAGKDFNIYTVVPDNANPHSFEPNSSQVMEISLGQVWFQVGETFEDKIFPILKSNNPNLVVKDLRDGIPMIEECGGSCSHCSRDHMDRHIWMSPKLAIEQAKIMEATLSAKFPEQREMFKENLAQLCEELASLDLEIQESLKKIESRTILVSHPAFGYFCKEYDLKQLSVELDGKDPRPRYLKNVLDEAMTSNMKLALALPQYNNKGVELIAKELDASVHSIDPYSADYFGMMRNLTSFVKEPYAN